MKWKNTRKDMIIFLPMLGYLSFQKLSGIFQISIADYTVKNTVGVTFLFITIILDLNHAILERFVKLSIILIIWKLD